MKANFDNSTIRRQERLLDKQEALHLLHQSEYGILSFIENREGTMGAYAIPINYVWNQELHIYFHCAPQGHKLNCMELSQEVCFTLVGQTNVISHKFTTAYQSVVVRGTLCRGLSADERMDALKLFLQKYSPSDMEIGMKYAEKSFHRTEILRLQISHISAKAKQVNP